MAGNDDEKTPPETPPSWQPLTFDGLRARLTEAKRLLEQAAVVGATQDLARLEGLAKIERITREQRTRGAAERRRYR